MPRTIKDAPITTRAARERLAPRHRPYWRGIEHGAALGYRKGVRGGVWLVRITDSAAGGGYRQASLGLADDELKVDGAKVLDFRQAETKARDWVARQNRVAAGLEPQIASAAPYRVADAVDDYLADYTARGGKGVSQTRATIEAHIKPVLGDLVVSRLTRDGLKTWLRDLAASPARLRSKKGKGPKLRADGPEGDVQRKRRATANRVLTVLKAALNHAKEEGKVTCPADAWAGVAAFREADKPKVEYLLDDEAARLVNACRSDFRDLVSAALLTGARYGELAAMQVADFDPQAGTITIALSKAGRPRHVVLTHEGIQLFARLTAGKPRASAIFERDALARQASRDEPADMRRVRWSRSDQFRLMREACAAARISPPVGFHVLRHTYASRLAMRGVPIAVIAQQLGHSGTRMTERHYAHLAPNYVAETVRAQFGELGILDHGPIEPFSLRERGR